MRAGFPLARSCGVKVTALFCLCQEDGTVSAGMKTAPLVWTCAASAPGPDFETLAMSASPRETGGFRGAQRGFPPILLLEGWEMLPSPAGQAGGAASGIY